MINFEEMFSITGLYTQEKSLRGKAASLRNKAATPDITPEEREDLLNKAIDLEKEADKVRQQIKEREDKK